MGDLRTQARFPDVGHAAGHYESFYLKASHPERPVSLWIRYTVHKRPSVPATGSLWFTLFERGAGGPRAVKETLGGPGSGPDHYIAIGDSRFEPGRVVGRASGEGRKASWELTFTGPGEPFLHLPRDFMYRARLPKTKLLSPYPDARFSGHAEIDGHAVELDGWRGMVGHNWGAQHAERWIWMHGADFAEDADAWFDGALGRIKLGPVTTPWIGNGVLFLDGERHRLGGIERTRATKVDEQPDRCRFELPGGGISVVGEVGAPREDCVGWVYADPDGSEHNTVNCSAADMTLTVERPGHDARVLRAEAAAAYELGMRETDHGVPLQPFGDG